MTTPASQATAPAAAVSSEAPSHPALLAGFVIATSARSADNFFTEKRFLL